MTAKTIDFADWLEWQLQTRNWRPSDLARKSGVTQSTIGNILNRRREVGPDVARAIAVAFEIPPESVFRLAGFLPPLPGPELESNIQEVTEIMKKLSLKEQEEVKDFARYRYERSREKESVKKD